MLSKSENVLRFAGSKIDVLKMKIDILSF